MSAAGAVVSRRALDKNCPGHVDLRPWRGVLAPDERTL